MPGKYNPGQYVARVQLVNGTDPENPVDYIAGAASTPNLGAGGDATAVTANGSLSQGRATTAAPTYADNTREPISLDTAGNLRTVGAQPVLPASTDRSGTATTTSGGLNVPANAARKTLVGQNISAVSIGFNEQGGTAVIGTAGTYTVAAGISFSISTNKLVNFIAASGTAAVTMTET